MLISKVSMIIGTMWWLSSLPVFLASYSCNVAVAFTPPTSTVIRKSSSALRVATDPTETKKSDNNILFGKLTQLHVCIDDMWVTCASCMSCASRASVPCLFTMDEDGRRCALYPWGDEIQSKCSKKRSTHNIRLLHSSSSTLHDVES